MGYVGEDELEDGLRQQVARRQGEDLDLGRVLVFGDFLCSVKVLCISHLILLLSLQLVVEGALGCSGISSSTYRDSHGHGCHVELEEERQHARAGEQRPLPPQWEIQEYL